MIIHISGSSASGKSTVGNKIKNNFKQKVLVIDIDDLHINPSTRPKYWQELNTTKTRVEAKRVWRRLIHRTMSESIKENEDKIIIFVGLIQQSLANSKTNSYEIKNADYKFFLNVPINILLQRYYARLYSHIKIGTKKQNELYWKNVGQNKQYIMGSKDIIDTNKQNIEHAKKHNYQILSETEIMTELRQVLLSAS